jgi:PIN domain nuclease of toxin-antitoxin system
MKLLLDTHVLLWWLDNPRLISAPVAKAIADARNSVYVSAAIVWEIAIKKRLGKLECPDDLEDAIEANGFFSVSISVTHARLVETLPDHHRDPFDRMLVAQAISEGLTLATRDRDIMKYTVPYVVA